MELIQTAIDFFLHLDQYLAQIFIDYGFWTYLILFLVIFCETGLVVMPFLPGDSLLFAVGALAATSSLSIGWLIVLLFIAAILGDAVNYWIGYLVGPKVFREKSRFLKKEHLERTQQFYKKYGGKTIVIARFVPIIRTFAPFVAGIGKMSYRRFIVYNITGGGLWVVGFIVVGYLFGNLPTVKNNFTLVIFVIILISIIPVLVELVKARQRPEPQ